MKNKTDRKQNLDQEFKVYMIRVMRDFFILFIFLSTPAIFKIMNVPGSAFITGLNILCYIGAAVAIFMLGLHATDFYKLLRSKK